MIVGIDISKDTFDASWVVSGKEISKKYDYTELGLKSFSNDTPKEAFFLMEATGVYHTLLALRLYESKRQVSVCNPLVIKRYSQMKLIRAKTDKADARLIRMFGEENNPDMWSPNSEEINELKQAHSWLNDQIQERSRLMNRQEAHSHQAQKSTFVNKQMRIQLNSLNLQIKECEKHLEVVVKKAFC